jgi:hypothetical protein
MLQKSAEIQYILLKRLFSFCPSPNGKGGRSANNFR